MSKSVSNLRRLKKWAFCRPFSLDQQNFWYIETLFYLGNFSFQGGEINREEDFSHLYIEHPTSQDIVLPSFFTQSERQMVVLWVLSDLPTTIAKIIFQWGLSLRKKPETMKTIHLSPATPQKSWGGIICLTSLRSICLVTEESFLPSKVIMYCPLYTWVIFLTHYQWWSIWKAKCDYAIGQSLKATQRRKKKCHKNDRNSWITLPRPTKRALHLSAF